MANRQLRALYSEGGAAETRRALREATERAGRLEAMVQAYRGQQEALWHVDLAKRAERMGRKRRAVD
jgi:hypothetical protein